MKHVPALACEPPLLAQYRAAYPDEDRRPANEATATWDGFKSDQSAYRELLAKLAEVQQGLCIYCEQRLVDVTGALVPNDYQVEHVKVKSLAVGRVLDWHNLALACGGGTYRHHTDSTRAYTTTSNTSCGQSKGDEELPQGSDARTFPLLDALIEVSLDGRLSVNAQSCTKAGVAQQEVQNAIQLLNLDCERLRKTRQDRRDNVNAQLVIYMEEILNTSRLSSGQRRLAIDLFVAGRLQPDTGRLCAFWSAERSALGAFAETWIANHQGLFQ